MELKFLEEQEKLTPKSSVDIQQNTQPEFKPYIKRAFEWSKKFGFAVSTGNLKAVLEYRASNKKVLTIHEADIALRGQINLNNVLLNKTFQLGFYLTEDDSSLSRGVFELRSRFNKGIAWRDTKRKNASEQEKYNGDKFFNQLLFELKDLCLPVHDEELAEGFDKEFLKPEWLSWDQFNQLLVAAIRGKTIDQKREEEERQERFNATYHA